MSKGIQRLGGVMTAMAVCLVTMVLGAGCKQEEKKAAATSRPPVAPLDVNVSTPAPAVDPAAVLVEVDGSKLTVGEADKQITAMLGPQAAGLGADRMAALMGRFRQQVAERFVMRTLLDQEAARRKIVVPDSEVQAAVAVIEKRMPEGMTLAKALEGEGISESQFRSNLVNELRIKLLVESEVPTNMVVSDAEVAKAYEADKDRFVQSESAQARHILIKVEPTDDAAAKTAKKTKAESLQKQLAAGADFEKLAKENSDCPSKERGGDLGSFQRGQMVKPFEDAAFSQTVNQIGPVVETTFGYHIVQVTGRSEAKTNTLDEVKVRLGEHLKQRKQMEQFESFVAKLKGQAKIAYSDLVKSEEAK